jgi:hypothetical protein
LSHEGIQNHNTPFGILGKPLMSGDASNGFVMQEFLNVDFFHLKIKRNIYSKKKLECTLDIFEKSSMCRVSWR